MNHIKGTRLRNELSLKSGSNLLSLNGVTVKFKGTATSKTGGKSEVDVPFTVQNNQIVWYVTDLCNENTTKRVQGRFYFSLGNGHSLTNLTQNGQTINLSDGDIISSAIIDIRIFD